VIASGVTLKFEYLHLDLGEQRVRMQAVSQSSGNGFANAVFDNNFDLVRAGLNMRF
jgi:hypothetical protein